MRSKKIAKTSSVKIARKQKNSSYKMNNQNMVKKILNTVLLGMTSVSAQTVFSLGNELAPPTHSSVDNLGVEMQSAVPSFSVTDVSIGRALGLTHTISTVAGDFSGGFTRPQMIGPRDNFAGVLYKTVGLDSDDPSDLEKLKRLEVYKVFGAGHSADFWVKKDGTFERQAINNTRYELDQVTLMEDEKAFVMTAPDGTRLLYQDTPYISGRFELTKVSYPTGFTIYIEKERVETSSGDRQLNHRVYTNTGFQLHYQYGNADGSTPFWWSEYVPSSVLAFNMSEEYCVSYVCDYDHLWPKSSYEWPSSGPTGLKQNEGVFKVTDQFGRQAEFTHQPFKADHSDAQEHARITQVKDGINQIPFTSYEYDFDQQLEDGRQDFAILDTGFAVVKKAKRGISITREYDFEKVDGFGYLFKRQLKDTNNNYTKGGINSIIYDRDGFVHNLDAWNQRVVFERVEEASRRPPGDVKHRHRPTSIRNKIGNLLVSATFDGPRENVDSRTEGALTVRATYTTPCTDDEGKPNREKRNICNKPVTTTDAKGNTTAYEYHLSGQIARVTPPVGDNGYSPEKRYYYGEKQFAQYENSAGGLERFADGIYLLVAEKYCSEGNYIAGNDKLYGSDDTCEDPNKMVTTRYQYNHPNLLLTGVIVEAKDSEGELVTRKTCYEYDRYGHKIGELLPRAAQWASCNGGAQ